MTSWKDLPSDILGEIVKEVNLDLPSRLSLSLASTSLHLSLTRPPSLPSESKHNNYVLYKYQFVIGEFDIGLFLEECVRLGYSNLFELAVGPVAALDGILAETAARYNRFDMLRYIWKRMERDERNRWMVRVGVQAALNGNADMIGLLGLFLLLLLLLIYISFSSFRSFFSFIYFSFLVIIFSLACLF